MGEASVEMDEEYLFDPNLLDTLNLDGLGTNGLKLRPLQLGDYDKGYISLLAQLTQVGDVSKQQFHSRFRGMKLSKGCYYVTVLEDLSIGQVVGSVTLLVEMKFIHSCALKGYLEDVVVSNAYRGRQLGKLLVNTVLQLSQKLGLYKVILSCNDTLLTFYEHLGFVRENGNANMLTLRLQEKSLTTHL